MRRTKQIILTIVLTVLLVFLSWFAGQTRGRVAQQPVVVARHAIKAGTILEKQMLTVRLMPEPVVQADWIRQIEAINGLRLQVDLAAGEILQTHKAAPFYHGQRYPEAGPGRRLMTLELDAASANGYWLSEGNLVDIYLIPRSGSSGSLCVLENIRILKILDNSTSGGFASSAAEPLLCFDVSRQEAEKLALAENGYTLKLAVVNEAESFDGR